MWKIVRGVIDLVSRPFGDAGCVFKTRLWPRPDCNRTSDPARSTRAWNLSGGTCASHIYRSVLHE